MNRFYLATDVMLLIALGGTVRTVLLNEIERHLSEGALFHSSVRALEELYLELNRRGAMHGVDEFMQLLRRLLDSTVTTDAADLESAIHIDRICSIGYPRAIHAALVLKLNPIVLWSPDSSFDRVRGLVRANPLERKGS